jgi:hypothetical protein
MKLFGLYEHDNISALQTNHRKFCETNNFEYRSYRVANYYDKYRLIYQIMQENRGEMLLFIDSNSYFTTFEWKFSMNRDLFLQEKEGGILDNFFAVKSTIEMISLFKDHFLRAATNLIFQNKMEFKLPCETVPMIAREHLLSYQYEEGGIYFNIDAFAKFDHSQVLVRKISLGWLYSPQSLANLLCDYQPATYLEKDIPFEVINPGKKNALVTLHTPEIRKLGSISEQNLTDFCKKNNITYYIYREIPESLRHLSGSWCKPYLVLNHFDKHEYIAWIDSDILVTANYQMTFRDEIRVYNDFGDFYFNSGFMIFRATEKNRSLLHGVINRCDALGKRESTYAHNSDQKFFNLEYRCQYPSIPPLGNLETNCLPGFHHPASKDQLIHFMGIRIPLRTALMDVYAQKIKASSA